MSFFSGASNTTITGGSQTAVGGDQYVVQGDLVVTRDEPGIALLVRACAIGAMHDSIQVECQPRPKCHPGTRKKALQRIDVWMEEMGKRCHLPILEPDSSIISSAPTPSDKSETHGRILWLHGPAGAGKSAVAQTVSETYEESKKLLGSFFFSRGVLGRDSARHLFPTIAYQIAMRIPEMRSKIDFVVQSDPSIFEKPLKVQVKQLIVLPFQSFLSSTRTQPCEAPFLLILDGLDECENEDTQGDVLSLVSDLLHESRIPLCFLIVSRPEPHINHALRSNTFRLLGIAEEISLYADTNNRETHSDVRAFLLAEFSRIHRSDKHREFMRFVSEPWPSPNIIARLVERSGGYFIYVATVIRFVDERFTHPVDRLDLVLDAPSLEGPPFAELDKLYRQILSTNPKTELLMQILGFIFVASPPNVPRSPNLHSPAMIERVLRLRQGTVRSMLGGMHSLLRVSGTAVESFHASLQDFLLDKDRADRFFVDSGKHHGDLALRYLSMIDHWREVDPAFLDSYFPFSTWVFHASQASDPTF